MMRPIAFVRHYTGCKYPVIKVNSLEVMIAGDRDDADELAEFINSMVSVPAEKVADPNEVEVDQILARLESYYHGDEKLARGAKHLSVNTEDLRTLTDYIKFMRGQLRAANHKRG